jgi:hypothetical protein
MKRNLHFVFWSLVIIFVIILSYFIGDFSESLKQTGFIILAILAGLFFILGIALVVLAIRSKIKKKLKIFLSLTGLSASSFLVGVILHNFLYALATIVPENLVLLKGLAEAIHVLFFLIAIIGCPIVFLIGMIGTIILLAKKKR